MKTKVNLTKQGLMKQGLMKKGLMKQGLMKQGYRVYRQNDTQTILKNMAEGNYSGKL